MVRSLANTTGFPAQRQGLHTLFLFLDQGKTIVGQPCEIDLEIKEADGMGFGGGFGRSCSSSRVFPIHELHDDFLNDARYIYTGVLNTVPIKGDFVFKKNPNPPLDLARRITVGKVERDWLDVAWEPVEGAKAYQISACAPDLLWCNVVSDMIEGHSVRLNTNSFEGIGKNPFRLHVRAYGFTPDPRTLLQLDAADLRTSSTYTTPLEPAVLYAIAADLGDVGIACTTDCTDK